MFKTLEWTQDGVVMIDQRKLPGEELYPVFKTYQEVAEAIRDMVVRGAPAIGVAAAMGVALGVKHIQTGNPQEFERQFGEICETLASTRPTAVNLFWAIERMKRVLSGSISSTGDLQRVKSALEAEAVRDARGRHRCSIAVWAVLAPASMGERVLTHCNAGALATAGFGTALGVIRAAVQARQEDRCVRGRNAPVSAGLPSNRMGTATGQYRRYSHYR